MGNGTWETHLYYSLIIINMVARRSARPLAPYARSGTTVPIKKGIRNPAADFARIMAVLKDTGEWPKYRKGVHNLLYSRLSAAKKGDDAKDSYPELALLMDREFPEGQWRVHGRLTRLERLALQGRVVSNSDSDTDGLPLKDHDVRCCCCSPLTHTNPDPRSPTPLTNPTARPG